MAATTLGRPLRDWLVSKLIDDVTAAKAGLDHNTVKGVVTELLAEKSIFEWLLTVNWAKLIELVLTLLSLMTK